MIKLVPILDRPEAFRKFTGMDSEEFNQLIPSFQEFYDYSYEGELIPDRIFTEIPQKLFVGLCYLQNKEADQQLLEHITQSDDKHYTADVTATDYFVFGKRYSDTIIQMMLHQSISNSSLLEPEEIIQVDSYPRALRYYQQRVDELAGIAIGADASISAVKSELKKKNDGLSLLNNLQDTFDASMSTDQIFLTTLKALNIKLRMDISALLLPVDEQAMNFRAGHIIGSSVVSGSNTFLVGDILSTKQDAILINRKSEPTEFSAFIKSELGLPFFIAVPVISHNKVIAILVSGRLKELKPFFPALNETDIDLLKPLAAFISVAYTNANMYALLDTMVREKTDELVKTQATVVQSEKMASLGQLTAGIAHEINNPINFVSANVTPIKRDIASLKEVLDMYAAIDPQGDVAAQLEEVSALKENIDYDYTLEELDILLKGIEEGAKRTSEIVKGLRNFSRLDEAEHKPADVREGLDSTIILLQSRLKSSEITVEKDYASIADTECYPGQLNQVFMNILTNSLQATEAVPERPGIIRIRTMLIKDRIVNTEGQAVSIRISDNGIGMSDEVRTMVFNPFFTTQKVGSGTGLGLSICYGIIEKHQGRIDVASTPGEGSHISIIIPYRP